MKTVLGLSKLPLDVLGSVATLGVFDGVHRGHQAVIERALLRARSLDVPAVAVTFAQHPADVLQERSIPMLTSLHYRLLLLERQGLDVCLVLEFTPQLARMSPGQFLQRVFIEGLKARVVVVGFDCRFGSGREGDVEFLMRQADRGAFEVESVAQVTVAGEPVSSTAIRQLVAAGDFEAARAMLGRPYSIMGTVVTGAHRGTGLGFPTANLDLQNVVMPPEGVYVACALVGADEYQCLVSIGDRPTFPDGTGKVVLEAYLLDFDARIYDRDVEVQLLSRVRPQEKYASGAELVAQMKKDLEYARRFFAGDLEG